MSGSVNQVNSNQLTLLITEFKKKPMSHWVYPIEAESYFSVRFQDASASHRIVFEMYCNVFVLLILLLSF